MKFPRYFQPKVDSTILLWLVLGKDSVFYVAKNEIFKESVCSLSDLIAGKSNVEEIGIRKASSILKSKEAK